MALSKKVDWPEGFYPGAAVLYATGEIHIDAPPHEVWEKLVMASAWPSWYPNSADVKLKDGEGDKLGSGAQFCWTTYALAVESHVSLFEPVTAIGWHTRADGIETYFVFTLEAVDQGTLVTSQEVANGPGAELFKAAAPHALSEGHALWLASLRNASVAAV